MRDNERRYNVVRGDEKVEKPKRRLKPQVKLFLGILGLSIAISMLSRACEKVDALSEKLYLVKVSDCDADTKIYDVEGNEIDISVSDGYLAVVESEKTKKGKTYPVILSNSEGQMTFGYMDGRYLEDNKALDSAKNIFEDDRYIISEVFAKDGLWLRKNTTVDMDTDDAVHLSQKTNLATSPAHYSSKDNSYSWVKALYIDEENAKMKLGYVASDYVLRKDYDVAKGKRFIVSTTKGSPLKLREEVGNMSNESVVCPIPNGSKIEVLPNMPSIHTDNKDWLYVAYKHDNIIDYGYVAATVYSDDGSVDTHYIVEDLQDTETIFADGKNDNYQILHVDTSGDGGVDLKLRDAPGTDSEIISYIENGSSIFSYQSIIDNSLKNEKVDNHDWLKVVTLDGQVGYVAADYLAEINDALENNGDIAQDEQVDVKEDEVKEEDTEKKESNDNAVSNLKSSDTISMSFTTSNKKKENTVDGYFAVDITDEFSPQTLEMMLKSDNLYDSSAVNDGSYLLKTETKPFAVIIKLGATGYGLSQPVGSPSLVNSNYNNIRQLITICEEYHVPYGFYYYSQALTNDEAIMEVDKISSKLDEFGNLPFNMLPFYLDVESPERGRLYNYCVNNNSDNTSVVNFEMNALREVTGKNVCLYTDSHTLKTVINIDKLEKQNKADMWCVEVSPSHTDYVIALDKYISMRQVALDRSFNGKGVDYNFINKDYYDSLVDEKGKSLVKE